MQKEGFDANDVQVMSKLGVIDSRESWIRSSNCGNSCSGTRPRGAAPFTGKPIKISDLNTDMVEIEHLLPFSKTLDDSMSNKTVCYRVNREKANRSPFEAFGLPQMDMTSKYIERSKSLPYSNVGASFQMQ